MKKNIKIILLSIVAILFSYAPTVHAETKIKSWDIVQIDGKNVSKLYDNSETGSTDNKAEVGLITIIVDGKEYPGYCIDFGMVIGFGTAEIQNLQEYYSNILGESAAKQLIKKLTEYVTFGYGTEGKNTAKYYLATQQLIWEAISDTGFFATDFYVEQTNNKRKKLKIENFRWTNDGGATTIDVSAEINSIKNSISNYYKTPSFCSSQNQIEIELGESAEYTDNNNVLSKFKVNCENGLECQTNGNILNVKAINEAGSNKITFSKAAPTDTEAYVYRIAGHQGVITYEGRLEPVSCEFGIDSYQNVKTADGKIVYILIIGIFAGIMAYISYYTKKSLNELK